MNQESQYIRLTLWLEAQGTIASPYIVWSSKSPARVHFKAISHLYLAPATGITAPAAASAHAQLMRGGRTYHFGFTATEGAQKLRGVNGTQVSCSINHENPESKRVNSKMK